MRCMRGKNKLGLAVTVLFVIGLCACGPAFAGRIAAWGWNYYGQCDVPRGNDFVAISARFKHSLALRSDGSIAGWGQNNHGQSDCPKGNDFVAVGAGTVHSLALKSDGSLVAWGYNGNGECSVPAGNDFVAIAAGDHHNLARRSDGSLAAWGDNDEGECNVPAGNDFVAIAAGHRYSLALRSDGSLAAWGAILWRPCTTPPGLVFPPGEDKLPVGNDFIAIAAGSGYGLALKSDGSLVAWPTKWAPCPLPPVITDVPSGNDFVAIAAGSSHSLALKSDGSVAAWGLNEYGMFDVPSIENIIAIAAGGRHNVALFEEPATGLPVADAGNNLVASANEEVTLDASNSNDPDGEIILYTWKRLPDEVLIYSGEEPTCQTRALGRAEEVIELTVTDNSWLTSSDTVVIINRLVKSLRDRLDGMNLGDLNHDRDVNMVDFALLVENWLE